MRRASSTRDSRQVVNNEQRIDGVCEMNARGRRDETMRVDRSLLLSLSCTNARATRG